MTGKEKGKSVNRTARVAGFLYLLVFPLAIFSLNVRDTLIVPEDAAATASNIMASEGLFRGGMLPGSLARRSSYSCSWPYTSCSSRSIETLLCIWSYCSWLGCLSR